MYLDNLDRMKLSLIYKIETFRKNRDRDPRVILFEFTRASNMLKVHEATNLMEHCKTGKLETNFNGKHKCIVLTYVHVLVVSNGVPDTSVFSRDRWRIWKLGAKEYENVIWPCKVSPYLKNVSRKAWNIRWTVCIKNLNLEELKVLKQYN